MNISFLCTVHNEVDCFKKLLDILDTHIQKYPDDEVVILDDFSTNPQTIEIINTYKAKGFRHFQNALNKNYGEHKTVGSKQCSKNYIFQLDSDEYPSEFLLENIHEVIDANDIVDLFWVPRVNILRGLEHKHLKVWPWNVSKMDNFIDEKTMNITSDEFKYLQDNKFIIKTSPTGIKYYLPIINFPDFQSRLYRNKPEIQWTRKLHEHVIGFKTCSRLPPESGWSIIHDKTIARQVEQNTFYNTQFTPEDNVRK